jgi:hypothetical protein
MYENGWGVPQDYAQAYMFNLWGLRVGDMVPEGERSAILQVAAKFLDRLAAKMSRSPRRSGWRGSGFRSERAAAVVRLVES